MIRKEQNARVSYFPEREVEVEEKVRQGLVRMGTRTRTETEPAKLFLTPGGVLGG